MEKYIVRKDPVPGNINIPKIGVDDIVGKTGCLFLFIGGDWYDSPLPKVTKKTRDYHARLRQLDDLGKIHFGMRSFTEGQLEELDYARFNGNYLIYTRTWNEDKLAQFLDFKLKPEIIYPEAFYVNINEITDDEAEAEVKKLYDLDKGLLGIDFETAGSRIDNELEGFPEYSTFLPLGLSITDKSRGYYFDFSDYRETKDSRPKFYAALEKFIAENHSRLMAFNVSFEIRCLMHMYNRFYELGDARAWCIVDNHKENLKYLSQFYLGAESWDYENDLQIRGFEELFTYGTYEDAARLFNVYKNMTDKSDAAFLAEAENLASVGAFPYDRKYLYFIRQAFNLNMDNPDFLPRLKKYWKNTWASTNQRILGRYCVIDAVMDLYLVDAVRNIKLNGKEYTEDSYMVYLYNQYLAAQITSSGITVDIPYLNKLKEFYERLYFNTMICISQFVTYTRRELIQQDKEYIHLDNIPDKIRILLEDYRTTFFLQTDPVKMAKEFVNFLCDSPEAFERVITKYRAELNDLYETALAVHNERQDDTLMEEERTAEAELKKLLRKKTVFVQKAAYIREDLELPQFFTEFNRKYLEKTNSNSVILFDYWNGKPESKLVEYLKHGTLRKTGLNEKICEKLEEYIWDMEQLTKPDILLKSLNIYLYDSYILEYEKIADRKITDPIDHSLDKLIIYDFNKPKVRDEIALDLQKVYEIPITISGLFYFFRNQADKMDMFTKSGFIRFRDSVISRCNQTCKGRFELMNHMHERMYEKVEEKGEYGKVLSVSERRKVWTAGGDDGYGGKSTWDGLKIYLYKDEPFIPDLTFRHIPDDKVECFNKFFGYMEMNRGAEKVLSTTVAPIIEHSYNYVTKDRMHIQWKKKQHDPEQPQMYQIDIHPNSVHTGRWASNFHTLPPEDDGRLALKFQKGYVGSYFDISQAEPRSICYISRDPDFMELYDSGKDAYMELAKIAFPHHMNDKALIKMHRKQCKGIILSGLYGRGIKGLAMSLGIPVEDANQIWTSFIGRFTTVAKFKDRLLKFAKANGRVDTILGNRIPVSEERVHTSSMNYVIQGFTAIILAAGFYNSVAEAVKHGIDVSVKGVVHDSSTCEFPIRHILHMDLHYRKFFREWIRHWWNPDYKYDLDLLMDYRHHCPYRFDLESGTVTLNMWTGYVDEFLEYMSEGYGFRIESREDVKQEKYKGGIINDLAAVERTHNYMDDDYARRIRYTNLVLRLTEPLKGIDWYYKPISEYPKWGSRMLDYTQFCC